MKKYRYAYPLSKKLTLEDGSRLDTLLEEYFTKPVQAVLVSLYNKEVDIENIKKAEKELKEAMKEFGQWVFNNTELEKFKTGEDNEN